MLQTVKAKEMLTFYLYTIFLLFVVIGFLLGVQSLVEWRRTNLDDYERRFLNRKPKPQYHNAEEKKKEHT